MSNTNRRPLLIPGDIVPGFTFRQEGMEKILFHVEGHLAWAFPLRECQGDSLITGEIVAVEELYKSYRRGELEPFDEEEDEYLIDED